MDVWCHITLSWELPELYCFLSQCVCSSNVLVIVKDQQRRTTLKVFEKEKKSTREIQATVNLRPVVQHETFNEK